MSEHTPRTAALLTTILDRDAELGPRNAPKEWVEHARTLETELADLRAKLDAARVAIKEAPHAFTCAAKDFLGGPIHSRCTCWKSAALAQIDAKPEEKARS